MTSKINIAIIGFGYWGPNLVRNFNNVSNCKISVVVDKRIERLAIVKANYPLIKVSTDIDEVLNSSEIDAIVIATPVFSHFEIAKKALSNKKHVLIEKPMTRTIAEAEELIALAEKHHKVIMVDHTFLYTGAVQKIKSLFEDNSIGTLKYIDSTRINLGLFQPDVNVLWDLAPHDISIVNYITNQKPSSVQAVGISHTNNGIENIAYLTMNYESDFIAHFSCSWSSPVKIRQMLFGGDKKMVLFNDLEPTEKIKIYDTGYTHTTDEDKQRVLVDYRVGDIFVPKIENKEALLGITSDYVNAITNNVIPVSDAISGLNVIKVLEAAQTSIKNGGKEIIIK